MDIQAAVNRLKGILEGLTYPGGATVFHSGAVAISSRDETEPDVAPPAAFIRYGDFQPYGHYAHVAQIADISIELVTAHISDAGVGHVVDTGRTANAEQEASLPAIMGQVLGSTRFIDTDASGNHSTWIRYMPSSGGIRSDGPKGGIVLNYEALVETVPSLKFTTQPSDASTGVAISPSVVIVATNSDLTTNTGFTGSITVALSSPDSGTLSGTTSQSAVSGVATFDDLQVDTAGDFRLVASASGFNNKTSDEFTIS